MEDKSIARASWLVFTLVAVGVVALFMMLDTRNSERDFNFIERRVLRQLIVQGEIQYEQFPLSPVGGSFIRERQTLPVIGLSYCRRVNWQQESNNAQQIRELSDEPIFEGLKRIREKYHLPGETNPEQFIPFEILTNEPSKEYHFAAVKVAPASALEFWDLDDEFPIAKDSSWELDAVIKRSERYGIIASDLKSAYLAFRSTLGTKVVNVPILGVTIEQKSAFLVLALLGLGLSILLLNSLRLLLRADLSKRTEPWLLLDAVPLQGESGALNRIAQGGEFVGTWLFHIVAAWIVTVLSIMAVVNYFPTLRSFGFDFWQPLGTRAGLVALAVLSLVLSIKITEYMWKLHMRSNAALYQGPEVLSLIAITAGVGIGIINGLVGIYVNERRFSYDLRETDSYRTWALVAAVLLSLFTLIIIGAGYHLIIKRTKGPRERAFVRKASILWISCTLLYLLGCWLVAIPALALLGFIAPIYGAYQWKKKELIIREHEMNAALPSAKESNG